MFPVGEWNLWIEQDPITQLKTQKNFLQARISCLPDLASPLYQKLSQTLKPCTIPFLLKAKWDATTDTLAGQTLLTTAVPLGLWLWGSFSQPQLSLLPKTKEQAIGSGPERLSQKQECHIAKIVKDWGRLLLTGWPVCLHCNGRKYLL